MAKYRDFDDDYVYEDEYSPYYDTEYVEEKRTVSAGRGKKPSGKKKISRKKKRIIFIVVLIVEFIVLMALLLIWYYAKKMSQIDYTPIDRDAIIINDLSQETQETLEGYTNILLLGSDTRDNDGGVVTDAYKNHTDAILIASINNKTKEVRLISIYRDSVMKIYDPVKKTSIYRKATESMYFFGIEPTISMINTNLDLDIKDFVMVNWDALIEIVDAVGGIDIEIDEEEQYWINEYLRDTGKNTGRTYENVTSFGKVHLDGIQTTAYCRIRATSGWDYRRTERQRTVISLIFAKAKPMNIAELNKAIDAITNNIATSLDAQYITSMLLGVADYSLTEQSGFPFDTVDKITSVNTPGNTITYPVVPKTLESNVKDLHKFLFDVDKYEVSDNVRDISQEIEKMAGK